MREYKSDNLTDIRYLLFKNMTFILVSDYELKHRKEHEDSRKQFWQKQLELLGSIDNVYAEKRREEIAFRNCSIPKIK